MVERVHASELMLRKLHVSWRLEVKQVLLKTRKTYLIHMSVCVCVMLFTDIKNVGIWNLRTCLKSQVLSGKR